MVCFVIQIKNIIRNFEPPHTLWNANKEYEYVLALSVTKKPPCLVSCNFYL